MRLDEKRLQQLALAYPTDAASLEAAQLARELIAARLVVEAAREFGQEHDRGETETGWEEELQPVRDALFAYDEATR